MTPLFHSLGTEPFSKQKLIILYNKQKAIPHLVREPAILLIKWLRPKALEVCSNVEKYAEFENQTFK